MAARTLKIGLPGRVIVFLTLFPLEKPQPWWELFGVDFPTISEISRTVLSLYRAEKPHYLPISIWAKDIEEKKKKVSEENRKCLFIPLGTRKPKSQRSSCSRKRKEKRR